MPKFLIHDNLQSNLRMLSSSLAKIRLTILEVLGQQILTFNYSVKSNKMN